MAHLSYIPHGSRSVSEQFLAAMQHALSLVTGQWSRSKAPSVDQTLSLDGSKTEIAATCETPHAMSEVSRLSELNPYCVSIMAVTGQLRRN